MHTPNFFESLENYFGTVCVDLEMWRGVDDFNYEEDKVKYEFRKEIVLKFVGQLLDDLGKISNIDKYKTLIELVENIEDFRPEKRKKYLHKSYIDISKERFITAYTYHLSTEEKKLIEDSAGWANMNLKTDTEKRILKDVYKYYVIFYEDIIDYIYDIYDKYTSGLLNTEVYTKETKKDNERLLDLSEQLVIIGLLRDANLFPKPNPFVNKKDNYYFLSGLIGDKDFKKKEKTADETLTNKNPTPPQAKVYEERLEKVKKYFEYISKDNQPIQNIIDKINTRISYLTRFREK